jgi:hypothetical protein
MEYQEQDRVNQFAFHADKQNMSSIPNQVTTQAAPIDPAAT